MSKIERFALFAGVFGLAADFLTLGTFAVSWMSSAEVSNQEVSVPVFLRVVGTFSLIYSWLIASWFLVQRVYSRFCERNRSVEWKYWKNLREAHSKVFLQYTIGAVFGIAILLLPIAYLVFKLWFPSDIGSDALIRNILSALLLEALIGVAISTVIMFIMPVVYADIEADLLTMLGMLNPFSSHRRRL